MSAPAAPVLQISFDDLGTPLSEVRFCVVDLETTGTSPGECGITEIGAVLLQGGRCLGTFQTLVNPGRAIPTEITVLTGITEAMVLPAPRIEEVLPPLLEFIGDAVVVGHNVRFDLGFIRAALERAGRPALANRSVDTHALARRLVRDEVPNCRLGTLATRLRLDHLPSHRALDDALATGDLLHLLLERAARLGVTGLDDLLALPTIKGHEQAGKLRLTECLPRSAGVYLFRDRRGDVIYVGKASNLRSRVRSYFSGDRRRKVTQLLRETVRIDHAVCRHPLEAAVREIRLIHHHQPRFNRQAKTWRRYSYLKLTLDERFPRFSVVRAARDDGALYLGPLPSASAARLVAEAVESVVPLRRCTARPSRSPRPGPCAPAQLGVATCPCAGQVTEAEYSALVDRAVRALTVEPALVLEPLAERMHVLAGAERFEEAADVRDRAQAFVTALRRQRVMDGLRRGGRVQLELERGGGLLLIDGRLMRCWAPGEAEADAPGPSHEEPVLFDPDPTGATGWEVEPGHAELQALFDGVSDPASRPLPRDHADEVACIARWLEREAGRVRLVRCERPLWCPFPPLPDFSPRDGPPSLAPH